MVNDKNMVYSCIVYITNYTGIKSLVKIIFWGQKFLRNKFLGYARVAGVFLTVINARVHNDHAIASAVVPAATTTGIWAQSIGCHAVGHGQ